MNLVRKMLIGVMAAALVSGCGTGQGHNGSANAEEYIHQVNLAFTYVIAALEASGSSVDVDASGVLAWQTFEDRLRTLDPPSSLTEEHSALVNAVERLTDGQTQDGLRLAQGVTDACAALEAKAELLRVKADLPCD